MDYQTELTKATEQQHQLVHQVQQMEQAAQQLLEQRNQVALQISALQGRITLLQELLNESTGVPAPLDTTSGSGAAPSNGGMQEMSPEAGVQQHLDLQE